MVETVEPSGQPAPYVCIAGPTASGKTAAALAVARRWPIEIISVDSALVYRGMDLGTAKPSAQELALVPHHLIDILDPTQSYSAAEFVRDARRLIVEIHQRGRMPLLVGGTMLYFKALIDGIDDMPAADPQVRAALDEEAQRMGWPHMHALLQQVDPLTAARLAPRDSQRIQRALEVYRVSGRPLSSFHSDKSDKPADADIALRGMISLEPNDRAWLHQRIAQRFDAMLDAGFIGEVQALRTRVDLHADLPAIRCVGYRQVWQALDHPPSAEQQPRWLAWLREQSIVATRQLAKRQITWLRSMPARQVVACDAADALEQVLACIGPWMEQA